MLGNHLARQWQGFEMWIQDCVLTKKEPVFFFFYPNYWQDVSVLVFLEWRKVCISFSKWDATTAVALNPRDAFYFLDLFVAMVSGFILKSKSLSFWIPIYRVVSASYVSWYAITRVHLCLIASRGHAVKPHWEEGQPLLFSDIRLQWKPDVFSDDMWLIYMALSTHCRAAELNSFRLSVSGIWKMRLFTFWPAPASWPFDRHQPLVTHHAPDDNLSIQLFHLFFRSFFVSSCLCLSPVNLLLCDFRIPFKIGQPKKQIVSKTVSHSREQNDWIYSIEKSLVHEIRSI